MAGSVCIVIVNYRTADLALDCLRSIALQVGQVPGLHAVVVDNASGDGSVDKLMRAIDRERWHGWASLLPLERNGGFAFGNNAGIREALRSPPGADYVMLLNPDTVVRDGAIRALAEFMDAHRRAGIAGSRLENEAGGTECSAHNAHSPLGELLKGARLGILSRAFPRHAVAASVRDVAHESDWVSGASLMARREVFDEIGLLDEGFFLYFEEADFCLRARRAGWQVWYVPESRVAHFEGAATGIRDAVHRRPPYWYDSRRRYFVKHFGKPGLILADVAWAAGRASLALRRLLGLASAGAVQDPRWFALDLLWGDFRSLFTRAPRK